MTDQITTGDNTFPASPTRPRVRWAGIVWGLTFATLAVAGIVLTRSPGAYSGLVEWVAVISIPTLVATALLTLGVAILVSGLVGLLRHAQRSLATSRASADHATEVPERHTT